MILRLADVDLSCIGFCVCCCLGELGENLVFFTFWPPLCCSASPYLEHTKNKIQQFGVIYRNSDSCLHCEPGWRTWFGPVERWLNLNFYSTIVPRSKSFSPVPPKIVLKKLYMFLVISDFFQANQKLTTDITTFLSAPVHSSKWQQKQRL